jgi:hypothetical protein
MLRTETSRAASMGQFPKTEHSVSRHDEYAGPDLTTVRRPRDECKSSPMGSFSGCKLPRTKGLVAPSRQRI